MSPVDRLNAIMVKLRDPVGGCPWDVEQTFATIAPYTLEEAYEVADAIERGDMDDADRDEDAQRRAEGEAQQRRRKRHPGMVD